MVAASCYLKVVSGDYVASCADMSLADLRWHLDLNNDRHSATSLLRKKIAFNKVDQRHSFTTVWF